VESQRCCCVVETSAISRRSCELESNKTKNHCCLCFSFLIHHCAHFFSGDFCIHAKHDRWKRSRDIDRRNVASKSENRKPNFSNANLARRSIAVQTIGSFFFGFVLDVNLNEFFTNLFLISLL